MTQEPPLRLVALFPLGVITMNLTEIGNAWAPRVLSILRIVSGLAFLQHGTTKYLGIPNVPAMANPSITSMSGFGGLIELVTGILLVFGLFTRPAAFLASGEMAVAYFYAHQPRGLFPLQNGGELAIMFCFVFFYIIFAGPGPWSVDAARGQK